MKNWQMVENDADVNLMADVLKLPPILAHILANRGLRSKNTALKFLHPAKKFFHDAGLMKDMDLGVKITLDGIEAGKKICIFGDYDADGICATTILHKSITALGGKCIYYIPDRETEGYGLNTAALDKLAGDVDILITCDNGIATIAEVAHAKALGMAVIIIDHHEAPFVEGEGLRIEQLPEAEAIIDPKQSACFYPFEALCAAGLCYKFSMSLFEAAGKTFELDNELLIFATLATFCDVVDLIDENRIIAANGLALMRENLSSNIGLNALVKRRDLDYNKIGAFEIGFVIGPCVNATGRLESAATAVELFLANKQSEATRLADRLAELNEERKALTRDFVEKTIAELEGTELDKVLVIYSPEMHESIAGIVAGRVKDALNRPAIVITDSGDVAKGSARSIEGYNIFEEMQRHKDLFLRFGGHPMAAGVTLPHENVAILRKRLNDACALDSDDFIPNLRIDKMLDTDDITFELAQQLEILGPFGKGNRKPVFCSTDIFTETCEIIGQSGTTMRLTFRTASGRKIWAVAFGMVDKFAASLPENIAQMFLGRTVKTLTIKIDIAYHLEINEYNGNKSLQLNVVDIKTHV